MAQQPALWTAGSRSAQLVPCMASHETAGFGGSFAVLAGWQWKRAEVDDCAVASALAGQLHAGGATCALSALHQCAATAALRCCSMWPSGGIIVPIGRPWLPLCFILLLAPSGSFWFLLALLAGPFFFLAVSCWLWLCLVASVWGADPGHCYCNTAVLSAFPYYQLLVNQRKLTNKMVIRI